MKLRPTSKLVIAAALGLAFTAITAQAALMVNVSQKATFSNFVGGLNNSVSNNGSFDINQVIKTGTPAANPYSITYDPVTGPSVVTLGTGTLVTTFFNFQSVLSPLNYFTSVDVSIETDFDNNSTIDLVQAYTIQLGPFVSGNGFTGVAYSIVPVNYFGFVTINGDVYSYASVVANASGTLFNNQGTQGKIQFQFDATPVPEPSSFAMFGVAALGGIVALRRRRSASVSLPALAA